MACAGVGVSCPHELGGQGYAAITAGSWSFRAGWKLNCLLGVQRTQKRWEWAPRKENGEGRGQGLRSFPAALHPSHAQVIIAAKPRPGAAPLYSRDEGF